MSSQISLFRNLQGKQEIMSGEITKPNAALCSCMARRLRKQDKSEAHWLYTWHDGSASLVPTKYILHGNDVSHR